MLNVLGPKEPNKHDFIIDDSKYENLSALELATARGLYLSTESVSYRFVLFYQNLSYGVRLNCDLGNLHVHVRTYVSTYMYSVHVHAHS